VLWAKSELLDIYLSGSVLALREGSEVIVQSIEGGDWQSPLEAMLAGRSRRRWRVWVGGRQCRLHLVDSIPGIKSIEEAELALSASLSTADAAVTARLAIWSRNSNVPWVTAAVPANVAQEVPNMLERAQGGLVSLRPWWTAVRGPQLSNAAMCDDEAISYWRSDAKGRLTAAATIISPQAAQVSPLQRLRVSGPLAGWRLTLQSPEGDGARAPGFTIQPLEETDHVADAAAV